MLPVVLLVQVMSLYFKIFNQFIHREFILLFWNACKILTTVASWGSGFHSSQDEGVSSTLLVALKEVSDLWQIKRKNKKK